MQSIACMSLMLELQLLEEKEGNLITGSALNEINYIFIQSRLTTKEVEINLNLLIGRRD
ncbi:hypothetical protein DB43_HG00080 [Parachlamydia acanthamoebae]|uniref:Uncharacterized protein n=1 Tax=Parachlamydia acanthamoebae TaxID=83552 RepID=A0A0C1E6D4_9BACT|nr:hypothetical protein DB43_HG00080 [Parachlamydia acanthamoebae]